MSLFHEPETNTSPELEEKLAELSILKQSLDESKAKEKSVYDQLLRLGADFENYRKRADQRIIDARKNGRDDILNDLLSIGDALIQADASSATASDVDSLKKGIRLVLSQFEKFLKDQGVTPISAIGAKADPHLHDVLAKDENSEQEDGVITAEIQRGYMQDGRVIRSSKVRVAVSPKPGEETNLKQEE